jgi:hypothetical protein
MPTAAAELERLNWLIKEGSISPDEPCKLVLPRVEARKRAENKPDETGKRRTRLIKELDSPETYSEFEAEFSRYKEAAGNVQVAYSIMLRCLQQLDSATIKRLAEPDEEVGGLDTA